MSLKKDILAQIEMDKDLLKKAVAKNERWMKQAYGQIDYGAMIEEVGFDGVIANIKFYAEESAKDVQGTFNRHNAIDRMKVHKYLKKKELV